MVFLIFGQGYFTFLYQHTKYTTKEVKEKKNNHEFRLVPSTRGREVCSNFVQLSVFLLAIVCVYLRETSSRVSQPGICRSTGPSSRLYGFCWLVSSRYDSHLLTDLFCRLVSSATFCWLCPSSLDCFLMPTVLCSFLLTVLSCWLSLGPSFPRFLPVSSEISRADPLRGFRAKTDKGILWLAPTPTETDDTHSVTYLIINIYLLKL